MAASIAEGRRAPIGGAALRGTDRGAVVALVVLVVMLFALYQLTRPGWQVFYNHFVWQADAWLHGQVTIPYPVAPSGGLPGNAFFNDVAIGGLPAGRGLIPFPPLPAVVLLPFVTLWGMATDEGLISVVLGALDVAVAFWMLGRLPIRPSVRLAVTIFVGTGTALWYAASLGSTWYFAHVVAVPLTLAAVAVALEAADRPDDQADRAGSERGDARRAAILDSRFVLAGLLLGLAAVARLTVALGFPFLLIVGGRRGWLRRGVSSAMGLAIPILGLFAYNLAFTGSLLNPAYEELYRYEVWAYPQLGYNGDWSFQDVRYVPQNLGIMLLGMPQLMPVCDAGVPREAFSTAGCSWIVPRDTGMSFVLAYPGVLLALAALRPLRDPRVAGALAAAALIAFANLMHFSQGWVQFGYRFSLDFLPFLLVPVALGAERLIDDHGWRSWRGGGVVAGLIAASGAIEAWGIAWARTLGW